MKRLCIYFVYICILFVNSSGNCAEPIYAGKSYVPKENGVAMSLSEVNVMKQKIEEGEKAKKLNEEYVSLLEDYRKLKDLQQQQLEQFASLDKLKQESITIYREATLSYKQIIGEMRENYVRSEAQLRSQKRTSRWQRNLNFIVGFAAPILGAKAFNAIK